MKEVLLKSHFKELLVSDARRVTRQLWVLSETFICLNYLASFNIFSNLGSSNELNGSLFLSFSKTKPSLVLIFKQFRNCVTALTNTAVFFLSFNGQTATVFSLKHSYSIIKLFVSQSYLGKVLHGLISSVWQMIHILVCIYGWDQTRPLNINFAFFCLAVAPNVFK